MPKPLKKQFYFMSPVQVVKVTTHNIEQAAEWCGGVIKTTQSRRYPDRMDKYIDVPVPKGAAIVMAFPGMYITKRIVITLEDEIKITYAVFRRDYFEKNYFTEPLASVDACWTRLENESMPAEQAIVAVSVANPGDVGKALEAARKKMLEAAVPAAVADNVITSLTETVEEVLSPAQQRMLITGNEVEDRTNPEKGNVVLPHSADVPHPSLRDQRVPVTDKILNMPADPALRGSLEVPIDKVQELKPFFVQKGEVDAIVDEANTPDMVVGETALEFKTTQEVTDAAQEIAGEPAAGGEVDDQAVDGPAGAAPTTEGKAEGRTSPEEGAEATYTEKLKEIENGDPDQ